MGMSDRLGSAAAGVVTSGRLSRLATAALLLAVVPVGLLLAALPGPGWAPAAGGVPPAPSPTGPGRPPAAPAVDADAGRALAPSACAVSSGAPDRGMGTAAGRAWVEATMGRGKHATPCGTAPPARPRARPGHGIGDAARSTLAAPPPSRPGGRLVPSNGVLLGGYIAPDADGWSPAKVTSREAQLGRRLAIDHRYYRWTTRFPAPAEAWDVRTGHLPMITWEPWGTTLDRIAAGADDGTIRARAAAVAAFGKPLFLRWGQEMNGDWYPWDGSHNGSPGSLDGPGRYVAAWRHIHQIFSAAGATNAVWVWCPNAESVPNQPWNAYQRYYPGDDVVDWVCIDGYNRERASWKAFTTIFAPVYTTYARRKPIMVGETASVEGAPGQKAQWISEARRAVRSSFPSIAALLWFDTVKDGNGWRVDSSATSLAAFRSLALDPYFQPGA
jgi:Glycosyl hydrolase family 26